jgi:hypothetical protein
LLNFPRVNFPFCHLLNTYYAENQFKIEDLIYRTLLMAISKCLSNRFFFFLFAIFVDVAELVIIHKKI